MSRRPSQAVLVGGRRPAFSGGNLRALGYQSALLPEQALVYEALMNAGASPEYALAVARGAHARVAQIVLRLSPGEIFQMLGLDLKPADLLRNLEAAGGGILGSIIGGAIGAALTENPYGAYVGAGIGFGAGESAVRGGVGTGGYARRAFQAAGADIPSGHGPRTVAARPRRSSFLDNLLTGVRALPQAISQGVDIANTVGPYLPAPFGGAKSPLPAIESAIGITSQEPATTPAQEAAIDAELAQDSNAPVAPPISPPMAQPDFNTPPGENVGEIPSKYVPSSAYVESMSPGGGGAGGGYEPAPQQGFQQGGGNQPVPLNSQQDCAICDQIHDLDNQIKAQIAKEVAQQQQQQDCQNYGENAPPCGSDEQIDPQTGCCQPRPLPQYPGPQPGGSGRPVNFNPQPGGDQGPLWNALQKVADDAQHLLQQDKIPPPDRNIPNEIAQKKNLRKKLKDLLDKATQQAVCFCVTCPTEDDAVAMLNGEQSNCNVIPGSTGSCQIPNAAGAPDQGQSNPLSPQYAANPIRRAAFSPGEVPVPSDFMVPDCCHEHGGIMDCSACTREEMDDANAAADEAQGSYSDDLLAAQLANDAAHGNPLDAESAQEIFDNYPPLGPVFQEALKQGFRPNQPLPQFDYQTRFQQ